MSTIGTLTATILVKVGDQTTDVGSITTDIDGTLTEHDSGYAVRAEVKRYRWRLARLFLTAAWAAVTSK
ncbi:hypothetical protein [Gulosibacter molinativorax]|uniref:Uncharacterized protein n=2 Tax=Gulosibacter molinativorax TaxID=256821 RepID=A0ABT7C983_9MICO|nr:hypothetical protein [Gulosibacter molinativorax]MDJ1371750.1 hypothetical protein [Gulosibacter molinativorax]QUY60886.1 Hypotetical protein [Gulosibacter molinativorax]